MENIAKVKAALRPYQKALMEHEVYGLLQSLDDLKLMMEQHVFAVWDFMSLLKALQIKLTCTTLPWVPSENPTARRLINDIVLEEESDINSKGAYVSHFEMYLEAMELAGADTRTMHAFMELLHKGKSVEEALFNCGVAKEVCQFVSHTFEVINEGKTHEIAAAFTFGREAIIPAMFREIVKDIDRVHTGKLDEFCYYLDRHIALDEEIHTPMAMQMITSLCGDNTSHWNDVIESSKACLQARILLWDHIAKEIKEKKELVLDV